MIMRKFTQQEVERGYDSRGEQYPLRVEGAPCARCGRRMELFRESSGGFVKHRCVHDSYQHNFSPEDFAKLHLTVPCPACGADMQPTLPDNTDKNYTYRCSDCNARLPLGDLLPYDKG